MNTLEYIDAMKLRLSIDSDYALAKRLNVTQQSVSAWRKGKTTIGDELAPRVAEVLAIKEEKVLADLHAERASNEALKAIWKRVAAAFACTAAIGIGSLSAPTPASAFNLTHVHGGISIHDKRRRPIKSGSCPECATA